MTIFNKPVNEMSEQKKNMQKYMPNCAKCPTQCKDHRGT